MELQKIEQLLDKYFEGEASLAEEQQLQNYFKDGQVAAHLEVYKDMFAYFSQAKEESLDTEIAVVSLAKSPKNLFSGWYAIAAMVVVVLGITFFFQQNNHIVTGSEEQEAIMAYEKTKDALQMLSRHFNESTEQLAYIHEFETSKNKIFK